MAKTAITGISVDNGAMRWATFRHGKAGLEHEADGTIEPAPREGQAGDVGDAAASAGAIAALKPELVLGVPFRDVLLRVVRLPTDDPGEVRGMVELQVDKLSPFPAEQTVASHEVVRRDSSGASVLIAVARLDVLNALRTALGERAPGRVDAATLGLWNGLMQSGALAPRGRELLLAADTAGVQMIVHEAGMPLAFTYAAGPFDLASKDDLTDIAGEAVRLLLSLEAEQGRASDVSACAWADPGVVPALADAVGRACGVPCRGLDRAGLPSPAEGLVRRGGRGAAAIDLTPAAWTRVEVSALFRRRMWMVVGVVLATWGLLVGTGFGLLAFQRHRMTQLDAEEAVWRERANEVRTMRRRVTMIQRYMDRRDSALECLREIGVMQPQGIDLDTFTYRKDESVDISGVADTSQLVLQFNESLGRSPIFKQVVSGPRSLTRDGKYRFGFDLKFASPGGGS